MCAASWSPAGAGAPAAAQVPLPEHPRPDFERAEWINLNGPWAFRFDPEDAGIDARWYAAGADFPLTIVVPFSWAAPLSGLGVAREDEEDIGWYRRSIEVPEAWRGRRVFLNVGASDWLTSAWLDGEPLGTHQGGYTPFAFELTPHVRFGEAQRLVFRVDDGPRPFKLEGKQGYGPARGIWQTVYLEARGSSPLETLHVSPDLDAERVLVSARLLEPAGEDVTLRVAFRSGAYPPVAHRIPRGAGAAAFELPMPGARLWSLDDPFLYGIEATVSGGVEDRVRTYFGMRKISVEAMPGTGYPYVALNGEPIYLQLALDQAYHPDGYYTFPTDEFIRNDLRLARQIGLNGLRVHIKAPIPRKLYWADRLGLLMMVDVPNSWGEPTPEMRREVEHALRGMIARDYNHPSIFAWVAFNENWGLLTREGDRRVYAHETQDWVVSVQRLAKALDPTRLVEDNSPCCGFGHTETDLNSWHQYLPGWRWDEVLAEISAGTYPGSAWNFEDRFRQGRQPNINSEFGNVWGYEGSTGDVDWSWDYHLALNAFRRHPKIAGWLYTEHHDVINEWNGYWRFDRSEKETGLSALVEGMSLRDWHAPLYIAVGEPGEISREVRPGEVVEVPLFASFLTGSAARGDTLRLRAALYGWNDLGTRTEYFSGSRPVPYRPWMAEPLPPLAVPMPGEPAVAVLAVFLEDEAGHVLHRNFTTYIVNGGERTGIPLGDGRLARVARVKPPAFVDAAWSLKQWDVLDGLKVNGAGSGFFEYRIPWPADLALADVESAAFVVEAGAKQLFGKDRDGDERVEGDFMRGLGTHDPGLNPNAYPMTDTRKFPSAVTVRVNGEVAGRVDLEDDPADHRGILSWHAQLRDRRLREAGSYGQLVRVPIPRRALERAARDGALVVRLEVDEALPGGLAIYGARFGRYPLDPGVVLVERGKQERQK